MNTEIHWGVAFLAGLASFLAPCVLPMVPAYLGYLSGYAVIRPDQRARGQRFFVAAHAVAFVSGFTLVFVLLGALAGSVGQWLRGGWLRFLGGTIIILLGLSLLGWVRLPFLYREARVQWRGRPEWGFLSSFLIGMAFAAGWTPCVGPALTSILILSADQRTVGQAMLLLALYALGLGVPFILAGLLFDRLGRFLQRVGRYLPLMEKITGVILLLVGGLLLTDSFALLGHWLQQWGIGWDLGI